MANFVERCLYVSDFSGFKCRLAVFNVETSHHVHRYQEQMWDWPKMLLHQFPWLQMGGGNFKSHWNWDYPVVFEKTACAALWLALYSLDREVMKDPESEGKIELSGLRNLWVWEVKGGQRAFRFPSRWWISSPIPVNTKGKDEIQVF